MNKEDELIPFELDITLDPNSEFEKTSYLPYASH
jgi:hypothetical protein